MNAATVITSALSLVAGVGIFLIACSMLSSSLEALAGGRLKTLLEKSANNKLIGVGIGTVATAAVQSSSATTVMVIGFVNAGLMTLKQAATVIFGANIGTTVTGQIVALGLFGDDTVPMSAVFAALAGIGAFVLVFAKKEKTQKVGGILAGFGMLFVGLTMMTEAMRVFSELDAVRNFLAMFENPILLVIVGTLLTAIVQSSSVMTSMAITMTVTGLITLDQGIYLTMGSNIGTCITAIIAGLASSKNAKLAALIHLIFNVGGTVVFMIVGAVLRLCSTDFGAVFSRIFTNAPQMQLAMFHTVFNVVSVMIALPLTDRIVKLAEIGVRS